MASKDLPNQKIVIGEIGESSESKATLGLTGPAIWSGDSKVTPDLQGVDISQGVADISPESLSAAADYADDMLKNGRRDEGTGNNFFPSTANSTAVSAVVGNSLPTTTGGESGNIYKEPAELSFTGGTLQPTNSTPGVGPNFFKSAADGQKIGDLIDKTGADVDKNSVGLYTKAEKNGDEPGALTVAVEAQLTANNTYDPVAESSPYTSKNKSSLNLTTDKLYYAVSPSPLGTYAPVGVGLNLTNLIDSALSDGPSDTLLGDAREATHSNEYKPPTAKQLVEINRVGDSISPAANGSGGVVFASAVDADPAEDAVDMQAPAALQAAGQGVPSSNGKTPGDDPAIGQILGTFFTQDQIDAVLDKTGGDPTKKGGSVFAPVKMSTTTTNVQTQLGVGNKSKPDVGETLGQYTPGYDLGPVGKDTDSINEDVGIPGDQSKPGSHNLLVGDRTAAQLAQEANDPTSGAPGLIDNTNHPASHGQATNYVDPDTQTSAGPGDSWFKAATDFTFTGGQYRDGESTPGVGNSFFDSAQVDGTADAPGFGTIDNANELMDKVGDDETDIISTAVQTQLAAKNPYDPSPESSPYESLNTSADKAATDQLYIKGQLTLGKFEKDATSTDDAFADITDQGTLSNIITAASSDGTTISFLGDSREATHSNVFHPSSATVFVDAYKAGQSLSLTSNGVNGTVFASSVDDDNNSETPEVAPQGLQSAGLGLPSVTTTPGTDTTTGQTLGTFFTQAQIDTVLDKTGANADIKGGSHLFTPSNVEVHKGATQAQLQDSTNPNAPGVLANTTTSLEHDTGGGDFIWPKPAITSNEGDVSYPAVQSRPGVFEEKPDLQPLSNAAKQQVGVTAESPVPTTGFLGDNSYHPKPTSAADGSEDMSFSADGKISPAEGDTFFASDTTNIEATGQGLPDTTNTPGFSPSSGQTLGTFFTQDQVDQVLDKSGEDPLKLPSKLPDKVGKIALSVDAQMTTANVNSPGVEHAASIDFVPHDVDKDSNAGEDVLFPKAAGGPGVHDPLPGGLSAETVSEIHLKGLDAAPDIAPTAKLDLNPNKPDLETVSLNTSPTLPKSAGPAFTDKSGDAFAPETDMVDMPGTGRPNFFTGENNAPDLVTDGPGLVSEIDGDEGHTNKVQNELDNSQNVLTPDNTYTPGSSVGTMGLADFPEYNAPSTANPDNMGSLFNLPQSLGEFSKDSSSILEGPNGEATVEAIGQIVGIGTQGSARNEYHPDLSFSQLTANDTKERRAKNKLTPGDQSDYFVNDQNTEIGGFSNPKGLKLTVDLEKRPSKILTSIPAEGTIKVPAPGKGGSKSYANPFGVEGTASVQDPSFQSILSKVQDMLKDTNMYSPSENSPFIKDSTSQDETVATQGLFSIQRILGSFIPTEPATDSSDPSGTRVTALDMSHMANSLLLRATGDMAGSLGLMHNFDQADSVIQNPMEQLGLGGISIKDYHFPSLKDATGGTENIGKKRARMAGAATGNLTFMQLAESASLVERGTGEDPGPLERKPMNATSHGQLTNWLEPFGNGVFLDSIGMLFLAVLAVATILIIGLIITGITGNIGLDENPGAKGKDPELLAFGKYEKINPRDDSMVSAMGGRILEIIKEAFRIPNVDYGFGDAMGTGMLLMIGFPGNFARGDVEASLATGTGLVDFALNLLMAPAYYANYMRTITMNFQSVMNSFADISGPNIASSVEKVFVAIDKLVNSKLYQFLMISTMVGDANMKSLLGAPGVPTDETLFQIKGTKVSVNPGKIVSLNKDESAVQKLATIAQLRKNVTRWGGGSSKNPLSLSTFPSTNVSDVRLSSLAPTRKLEASKENVRKMETALEAEYMPFYFHDLRTHEIISMPAFVTSFDESYAVNYTSTPSYGRQDPVRIYNATERTINLSFKLVAFSKEDFTSMWYTINKFVSMLYPQYTKGLQRTLKNSEAGKEVSFIQPFSQAPAASPLIRIRLGDLYKSNYSSTALRNLFGYNADKGNTDFKIGEDTAADALKGRRQKEKRYNAYIAHLKQTYSKAQGGDDLAKKQLYNLIIEGHLRAQHDGSTVYKLDKTTSDKIKISDDQKKKNKMPALRKKLQKFVSIDGDSSITLKKDVAMVLLDKTTAGATNTSATSPDSNEDPGFILGRFALMKKGSNETASVTIEKTSTKNFMHPATMWEPGAGDLGKNVIEKYAEDDANNNIFKTLAASQGLEDDALSNTAADLKKSQDFITKADEFFKAENNAIVRSFNSTKGRGLAGFITSMAFDYTDSTWSVEQGSRAPKSVGITIAFAPVHDVPVGMDSQGKLRGLSHPTGKITQDTNTFPNVNMVENFGDVYSGDELGATPDDPASYDNVVETLEKVARRGFDPPQGPGLGL